MAVPKKKLLEMGALRQVELDKMLFKNCQDGDLETARMLIIMGANPNYQCRKTKNSCLLAAVNSGNVFLVKLLLSHWANINLETKPHKDALFAAVSKTDVRAVKALLDSDQMPIVSEELSTEIKALAIKVYCERYMSNEEKSAQCDRFAIEKLLYIYSGGFKIYQIINKIFLAITKEKNTLAQAALNNRKQAKFLTSVSRFIDYFKSKENVVLSLCHNIGSNNLEEIKNIISGENNSIISKILDGIIIYSLYFSEIETFSYLLYLESQEGRYLFYECISIDLICMAIYARKYEVALIMLEYAVDIDKEDILKIIYSLSDNKCEFDDIYTAKIKKRLINLINADPINSLSIYDMFIYVDNINMFEDFITDSTNRNNENIKLLYYALILKKKLLANYIIDRVPINVLSNSYIIKLAAEQNIEIFNKIPIYCILHSTIFKPHEMQTISPVISVYLNRLGKSGKVSLEKFDSILSRSKSISAIKYSVDSKYFSLRYGINLFLKDTSSFQIHSRNLLATKYLLKAIAKKHNYKTQIKIYVEDVHAFLFVEKFAKANKEINIEIKFARETISANPCQVQSETIMNKAKNFEEIMPERQCYLEQMNTLFFRCAKVVNSIYGEKTIKDRLQYRKPALKQVLCIRKLLS